MAGPRGLPPAPAPLVDRGTDEPLHVDVDRRHAGRRSPGVPPHPAGQRPDRRPRRCRRTTGAPLHQVLCVSERLPCLRADRRTRLRLAISGPDRCDPHAPAARHRQPPGRRPDRVAAVRVVPVWRVLRGLPGQDRHPRGPHPPPDPGRPATRLAGRGWRGSRPDGDARLDVPGIASAGLGRAWRGHRRTGRRPIRAASGGSRSRGCSLPGRAAATYRCRLANCSDAGGVAQASARARRRERRIRAARVGSRGDPRPDRGRLPCPAPGRGPARL